MSERLTPAHLDELMQRFPDVFQTWSQQKRELIAQEPRDPFGRGQSDRDLDRARRNTPGIVIYDEPPLEDFSNANGVLQGDQAQDICRVKYHASQELSAVVRVFPPEGGSFSVASGSGSIGPATDANNPFNQPGASAAITLPATLSQMVEVIGYMKASHQNSSLILPFNIPLGQLVRLQAVGSRLDVCARLAAKCTRKLGGPTIWSWLVAPGGSNFDRNVAFDNPPSMSAFVAGNPLPIKVEGFCGKAFTAPVPAMRIFPGWVNAAAAVNSQHLCPVPRGARTVLLLSDASNLDNSGGASAAFQGVRLQFNQICQSPGAGTSRRMLNFPPNTTVLLRSDCVAIEVVNIDSPPAGQDVPFELQYDLGL